MPFLSPKELLASVLKPTETPQVVRTAQVADYSPASVLARATNPSQVAPDLGLNIFGPTSASTPATSFPMQDIFSPRVPVQQEIRQATPAESAKARAGGPTPAELIRGQQRYMEQSFAPQVAVKIPFSQKTIDLSPTSIGGATPIDRGIQTGAAFIMNFAINTPTAILEAIPRMITTIPREIGDTGKKTTTKLNPLATFLNSGDPVYKNVNQDIQDRLDHGDGILASYLGGISGKVMDVAFGASIAASGLTRAASLLAKNDTIAKIEAWKTLGSPKTLEEQAYNFRQLAHQLHPDKLGGSNKGFQILSKANDILTKNGLPSTIDLARTNASSYAEAAGRQTPLGVRSILSPDLLLKKVMQKEPLGLPALPGYRVEPGQAPAMGLSTQRVEPAGFGAKLPSPQEIMAKVKGEPIPTVKEPQKPFEGLPDLSTTLIEKLKGKTTVSKQYISDLTNSADLKQPERDLIRKALEGEGDTVNVTNFANKVKTELLPLDAIESKKRGPNMTYSSSGISNPKYESINLPDELRGPVANYSERIYQSPIKTSAGNVHFSGNETENYFAHTRVEDLPGKAGALVPDSKIGERQYIPGDTRRVIEIQSDLFQKGNLENQAPPTDVFNNGLTVNYKGESYTVKGTANGRTFATLESQTDGHFERNVFIEDVDLSPSNKIIESRKAQLSKLEPYRNTWQERIIREEIKKAAEDGKTKLQFPTGETAMKIEGLGQTNDLWRRGENTRGFDYYFELDIENKLTPENLKVGLVINRGDNWVVTDILGDGKFKAMPKNIVDGYKTYQVFPNEKWVLESPGGIKQTYDTKPDVTKILKDTHFNETFDISGKVDTNNPIYKFYEKEVGRFLTNRYKATKITDTQGVTWYEVPITKDMANKPVTAFRRPIFTKDIKLTPAEIREIVYENIGRAGYSRGDLQVTFGTPEEMMEAFGKGVEGAFYQNALGDLIKTVKRNGKAGLITALHETKHFLFGKLSPEMRRQALDLAENEMGPMYRSRLEASYDKEGIYEGAGRKDALLEEYVVDKWAQADAGEYGYKKSVWARIFDTLDKILKTIVDTFKKVKSQFDAIPNKQGGFAKNPFADDGLPKNMAKGATPEEAVANLKKKEAIQKPLFTPVSRGQQIARDLATEKSVEAEKKIAAIRKAVPEVKPASALIKPVEKPAVSQEISKDLEPLATEAKKYKSAEEFVKNKPVYYRGTTAPQTGEIKPADTYGLAYGKGVYLASDTRFAKDYGPNIKEYYVDWKNPFVMDKPVPNEIVDRINKDLPTAKIQYGEKGEDVYGNLPLNQNEANDYLQKIGFDGLKDASTGYSQQSIVFNSTSLKTKSQLTDFYNQVTGKLDPERELKKAEERGNKIAEAKVFGRTLEQQKAVESRADVRKELLPPSVSKTASVDQLFSMLRREEASLAEAMAKPEAHKKAYGVDKKPEYEARIKALKNRIETMPDEDVPPPSKEDAEMAANAVGEARIEAPEITTLKDTVARLEKEISDTRAGTQDYSSESSMDAYSQRLVNILKNPRARAIKEKLADGDLGEVKRVLTERGIEFGPNDFNSLDANMDDEQFLEMTRDRLKKESPNLFYTAKEIKNLEIKSDAQIAREKVKSLRAEKKNILGILRTEREKNLITKFLNKQNELSDKIVREIANPEKTPGQIQAELRTRKANASQHLRELVGATYKTESPLERESMQSIGRIMQESHIQTQGENEALRLSDPLSKIVIDTGLSVKQKINLLDYFRTPDRVLRKIGLGNTAKVIRASYDNYLTELPLHIDLITSWSERVPKEANQALFRYLDGQAQRDYFAGKVQTRLSPVELKVANEIKAYLSEWADRLGLPEDQKISHYITHLFGFDDIAKEFDEDLAKIIDDKVPGSVYDPFLEKRLGAKGYREDTWAALDAYVKRGVRKANMDPALERLKLEAETLELSQQKYITRYASLINLRPTEIDTALDNLIKTVFGYKVGQRPTAVLTRGARRLVYRAMLGLNLGSAIKNLTQGANTYAKLGEKYTLIGYSKLMIPSSYTELVDTGVLKQNMIEDRALSSTHKFMQNMDKGLFFLFDTAEKINRGAAYFGAKAKAIDAGYSEAKAIAYAKKVVRDTQFLFSSIDTPVGLNSDITKIFTQFLTFGFKQTEFAAEMLKNKEFAGIMRYILAALGIVFLVGKTFNIKGTDFVPGSSLVKFGAPPTFALPMEIYKAFADAPDFFGNPRDTKEKAIDILGAVPFPASLQIKKTYGGLKTFLDPKKHVEQSKFNILKAGLLGKQNLPTSNPEYYEAKTAKTKLQNETKNAFQKTYDEMNALLKEGKKEKVIEMYRALTPKNQDIFDSMKASETAKDRLARERAIYTTAEKASAMLKEGKKEEVITMYKAMSKEDRAAFDNVMKSFFSN